MHLRGWWYMELFLLCFLVLQPHGPRSFASFAAADCWYDGKRHKELSYVSTAEPCLSCQCKKGTLLCYLRVCPELPDPPPPGCVIVHKFRTCCPRLICSDSPPIGNELQSRIEPDDDLPTLFEDLTLRQACKYQGSIFEPGSAMSSSTFCEHCFCIRGKQQCIRPKCLLQVQGCQPVYENYSCCPVRYNCSSSSISRNQVASPVLPARPNIHLETTTTSKPPNKKKSTSSGIREGCFVSKKYYPEGSKVLGVGYSACDNCYCVRSIVRCEPMSCAPPLLGCKPIIKQGECCATSYNCNNSIEIQPNPNYGDFPEISKEYAKLRKEVPIWNQHKIIVDQGLHYVIAQSVRQQLEKGTQILHDSKSGLIPKSNKRDHEQKLTQRNTFKRHTSPIVSHEYPNFKKLIELQTDLHGVKPMKSSLKLGLEGRVIRQVENKTSDEFTTIFSTTTDNNINLTTVISSMEYQNSTKAQTTTGDESTMSTVTTDVTLVTETPVTENLTTLENDSTIITTVVFNSTCLETSTKFEELTTEDFVDNLKNTTENSSVESKQNIGTDIDSDIDESDKNITTEMDNKVTTTNFILLPAISPLIGSIPNDSVRDEDSADYDYSEPTLPPSLPNLRIIPFVAADAVDEESEPENVHLSQITESPPYTLFSPPTKTEGGFVPKEPPLILSDSPSPLPVEIFEKNIHIVTTKPKIDKNQDQSTTETISKLNYSCRVEGTVFEHGQTVPGKDTCTICTCLHGEIVCRKPECPPPEIYCQEYSAPEILACCPTHYCNNNLNSPIDRMDSNVDIKENENNISLNGNKITTGDHVKEVFSNSNFTHGSVPLEMSALDFSPLRRRYQQHTVKNNESKIKRKHNYVKVNEMIPDKNQNYKGTSESTGSKLDDTKNGMNLSSPPNSSLPMAVNEDKGNTNTVDGTVGVLKLAGCNIYGRMYRVGKIILELSGPCLECRCTDVGVQCKSNKC